MKITWTRQAHGYHQATFPNKNYKLFAHLEPEGGEDGPDGGTSDDNGGAEKITLGGVIVEENFLGELTFLLGSHAPFWPKADKILSGLDLTDAQRAEIEAALTAKIPRP